MSIHVFNLTIVPEDDAITDVTTTEQTGEILWPNGVDYVHSQMQAEFTKPGWRGKIQDGAHVEEDECMQLVRVKMEQGR